MKQWLKAAVAAGMMATAGGAHAADPVRININISGTVVANGSCSFNQGDEVTVDFGDVEFASSNGTPALVGEYRKTLPSTLDCNGDNAGAKMTLNATDAPVDYQGHKLLPVNINGGAGQDLGIRLLVNGEAQDINAAFSINPQSQPELQAELVQVGSGSGFTSGAAITASATLVVEFL